MRFRRVLAEKMLGEVPEGSSEVPEASRADAL